MKRQSIPVCALAMVPLTILCALGQGTSPGGVPVHMLVTVEARHGTNPPEINREDVMVREGHDRERRVRGLHAAVVGHYLDEHVRPRAQLDEVLDLHAHDFPAARAPPDR